MTFLDGTSLDIPCPQCDHKTAKTFGWIKAHTDFTCVGCGRTITLDRDQILGELRKAEKSISNLGRNLSKR